ncbi:hypothetical protein OOT46_09260 [Aquabacterium sp. A7-Y]|uniref:hypothetical protein n=1 Tax=Aquabacterium sp. A7-Y TaxID=1349605 RepID=UPI00223D8AA9|nr:hypothetical protein [Aquabacterium sp. A7-Y]MCW7538034.1 hypothetical protein [Aquabacterium sp. A7-Y]
MMPSLSRNPSGKTLEFSLSKWQKRQATLLYHFSSIDYLAGLKTLIDRLIEGADVTLALAKLQGREALLVDNPCGVGDTAASRPIFAFQVLEHFRQSTLRAIDRRAGGDYGFTGLNQCSRMIGDHSSMWMSPEEEKQFTARFEAVYRYASAIDSTLDRPPSWTDFSLALAWQEMQELFPRLPRFRVRTDIPGETDERPPRTGVYVPQDDPYGALQFAWAGSTTVGELNECSTLGPFGVKAVQQLGRHRLWVDRQAMLEFVLLKDNQEALKADPFMKLSPSDATTAACDVARHAFIDRPCKWFFVEMIPGEFDDEEEA